MYHIPNDIRASRSVEAIYNALFDCLENKPLAEIGVTEICRDISVGRATFYRLFDNVADVLSYKCDKIIEEVAGTLVNLPPDEMLLRYLRECMRYSSFWGILAAAGRMDLIVEAHRRHVGLLEPFLPEKIKSDPEEVACVLCHMSYALPAYFEVWCRYGQKDNAEELYGRIALSMKTLSDLWKTKS